LLTLFRWFAKHCASFPNYTLILFDAKFKLLFRASYDKGLECFNKAMGRCTSHAAERKAKQVAYLVVSERSFDELLVSSISPLFPIFLIQNFLTRLRNSWAIVSSFVSGFLWFLDKFTAIKGCHNQKLNTIFTNQEVHHFWWTLY